MVEVSNELIYEVLKSVQGRIAHIDANIGDMRGELQAIRVHMIAMQTDISNLYNKFAGVDLRLDRIERRLDLIAEPAE